MGNEQQGEAKSGRRERYAKSSLRALDTEGKHGKLCEASTDSRKE